MTQPDTPILLQPEHRVAYTGTVGDETRWTVDVEEDTVAELRIPEGGRSLHFAAQAILAGAELRAAPDLLPHLVDLVRGAADDPAATAQAANLPPDVIGALLASAAATLEQHGTLESCPPDARPELDDSHLVIPSPGHYAALQRALATRNFERVEGSAFPRASLNKGDARGYAELRPVTPQHESLMSPSEIDALAQRMWQQREELSDQDADTLDAISAMWINGARTVSDRIGIHIDDLLRARGLKSKKAGNLRRGGYEAEQRTALWRCLLHLQDLWLDIAEATVVEKDRLSGRRKRATRTLQSRAFVMTDRVGQKRLDGTMDVEAILITPGEAFGRFLLGPGRQVALLSSKALHYDPMRQKAEKRLARYLSWQWRIGAARADFVRRYKVRTLLGEIDLPTTQGYRMRNRLEKALDQLQADRVIAGWQYGEGWREEDLPRQGWLDQWFDTHVVVEAPEAIRAAYRNLDQLALPTAQKQKKVSAREDFGPQLKKRRQQLSITQLVAAEQIGISQAYVAQIERGRKPSKRVAERLKSWLR